MEPVAASGVAGADGVPDISGVPPRSSELDGPDRRRPPKLLERSNPPTQRIKESRKCCIHSQTNLKYLFEASKIEELSGKL